MADLRRKFGFWGAVGSLRLRDLAAPEFAWGLALGGGAAWYMVRFHDLDARVALAGDYLSITPALLGVVFAGFALVIALMSDAYIRLLQSTSGGALGFLRPFIIATGIQVGTLIGAVWYRAMASDLVPGAEPWVFAAVSILFAVSALDVVALARSVLMHGIARAAHLEIDDLSQKRERRSTSETG